MTPLPSPDLATRLHATGVLSDGSGCATAMFPLGKHKAGRELDGRTWDEYPTTPQTASCSSSDLEAKSR